MKLKYNLSSTLEVVGFGVFKPSQVITIDDELEAKRYLATGYFDEVKVRKEKPKYKPIILKLDIEKKIKKSKKKGVDK
ncbi:hypothetical protein ES705_49062 [subsurface metagenome]